MAVFKMRDNVPSARYSSVCNVLRQWRIWVPTMIACPFRENSPAFRSVPFRKIDPTHALRSSWFPRVMVVAVELTADAYLVCLAHALTTEKEEVMGLLLGEMKDNGRVALISSAYAMRRSDKQPDRVEIHPEQLSAAAMEAEQLAIRLRRPIQVLGWYHSHPHITVWPSHVDVGTQADYQLMDSNFIGVIFSCFHDTDKRCSVQVICFQSYNKAGASEPRLEYLPIPLRVVPTAHCTLHQACISALAHLPEILLEEEQESYAQALGCSGSDLLTGVHNGAVYSQRLTHILQLVCAPVMQVMETALQQNTSTLRELKERKQQLTEKCRQYREQTQIKTTI